MKISRPDKLPAVQEMIDEYQLLWKDIKSQIAVIKTECRDEIQKKVSYNCHMQHLVYCVLLTMDRFKKNIFKFCVLGFQHSEIFYIYVDFH
jgi:hypothetical protein